MPDPNGNLDGLDTMCTRGTHDVWVKNTTGCRYNQCILQEDSTLYTLWSRFYKNPRALDSTTLGTVSPCKSMSKTLSLGQL